MESDDIGQKLNEFIESLSPDEKILHAELIEECKFRDSNIKRVSSKAQTDLYQFSNHISSIYQQVQQIEAVTSALQEIVYPIYLSLSKPKGPYH